MDNYPSIIDTQPFTPVMPEIHTLSANKIKVVVHDYHDLYLNTFIRVLRHLGFNVVGMAHNEAELIEVFNGIELPDIAIINYKTSKRDSLNIAQRVKESYSQVKVIINTASSFCIPFKEMRRIGVDGWLNKEHHSIDQIRHAIITVYYGESFY